MRPVFACVNGADLLMDYVEERLPAADRTAVDTHLAGCPRCRAFVKSYLETPRILRAATDAAMPAAVQDSLRRFLAGRRRR
jgi:anti-sigma factor RsiW